MIGNIFFIDLKIQFADSLKSQVAISSGGILSFFRKAVYETWTDFARTPREAQTIANRQAMGQGRQTVESIEKSVMVAYSAKNIL